MKKHLVSFVIAAGAYAMPLQIMAVDNPTDEITDQDCSKEILVSYFPEVFVRATLQKFNVPQDKWDAIVKELKEKDKTVMHAVEEKASKLSQNPLKDPQQRQAAVKLFRETILEVFSAVLKNNGVTDDKQIKAMLDDIQQQTAKRFAACIKRAEAAAKAEDENDDSDEDDDEDEDDTDSDKSDKNADIKINVDSKKN